jgi:hypothetical protein
MKKLIAFVAGLALATSASAGSGSKGVDYASYASGDQLQEIKFFQLYNWHRSTDQQVVLWTKPSEAYLVDLVHKCDALRGGRVVIEVGGVAGVPGRLRTNDDLIVGQMKCRVAGIRSIDLDAMKAARKS